MKNILSFTILLYGFISLIGCKENITSPLEQPSVEYVRIDSLPAIWKESTISVLYNSVQVASTQGTLPDYQEWNIGTPPSYPKYVYLIKGKFVFRTGMTKLVVRSLMKSGSSTSWTYMVVDIDGERFATYGGIAGTLSQSYAEVSGYVDIASKFKRHNLKIDSLVDGHVYEWTFGGMGVLNSYLTQPVVTIEGE